MPEDQKPFDQAFKSLPEANPVGFLEALGVLPPVSGAEAELLPQELTFPTLAMDAALVVRPAGGETFIAVFEAFATFRPRSLEQVIEYNKGLDSKSELPLRTYLVPLVERAYPPDAPAQAMRRKGGYTVCVDVEWIRPWEIDAGRLLALGRPEFDAWTVLCRADAKQEQEALRRLRGAPGHLVRYKALGGLRYRGKEARFWRAFLERIDRMLTKEDWRESLAVQGWLEEGRLEGRLEGQRIAEEGFLRMLVARFPGIVLVKEIPSSVDVAQVTRELLVTNDEAAARVTLASAGLLAR